MTTLKSVTVMHPIIFTINGNAHTAQLLTNDQIYDNKHNKQFKSVFSWIAFLEELYGDKKAPKPPTAHEMIKNYNSLGEKLTDWLNMDLLNE